MFCIFHKWEEKEEIDNGPIDFPTLNATLFGATLNVYYEQCSKCGDKRGLYGNVILPDEGAVLKPIPLGECEMSA